MSRLPDFYSAVFAIIRDKNEKILFQKRQNTWFRDWAYQLPSGHLELRETIKQAYVRELKEELGIDVLEEDIEIIHIVHTDTADRVYFNIYANILRYSWDIKNNEISKCSEIQYFSFDEIISNPLCAYEWETLKMIREWYFFSEKKVS